jgi:hypothetical protein
MVTVLLLLPVAGILVWIYGYLLPRRWCWTRFDLGVIGTALALAAAWTVWVTGLEFEGAGPIFGHLAAAAGAYPIFLGVLTTGLAWRRRQAVRVPPR